MNRNFFGEEVRAARMERQVGLRELAGRLEVAPAYLSDIERGNRVPVEDKVRRLARELGINEDRWIELALKSRGTVDLPVGTGVQHTRRDEAALTLHRQWDSISEDLARQITELLEGQNHE
ncbi:MAG: helix-turn-helix domain-containing protein [Dehalococcoidia bacterium]